MQAYAPLGTAGGPRTSPGPLRLVIAKASGARVTLGQLAAGDAGTSQTLAAMHAMIQAAKRQARVREIARAIGWDRYALWDWARRTVTYEADPEGVELIREPLAIIQAADRSRPVGCDCDDLAVLLGSILAAAGESPILAVVGRGKSGRRWEHVLTGYLRDPRGPLSVANVLPFDPQEASEPGAWPASAVRMLTIATKEHA